MGQMHDHRDNPVSSMRTAAKPAPRRVDCGDMPFVIRRDGTWLYQGSPIGRKELVCLFASVLKREADGGYVLETPAERGRIVVEDAPFLAVEMHWRGVGHDQVLSFRTNCDDIFEAGPDHPIRREQAGPDVAPALYVTVRPGLEARISRAVYYELVALGVPDAIDGVAIIGVWSNGAFFPLGETGA